LHDIPVTALPRHIKHWVSFFLGGLVPLLEGHLKTGGTVGIFSGTGDSPDALAILDQRLLALHATYPLRLPRSAISRWKERLPGSILTTPFSSWTALPPVTFLEAGQCYPPDSYGTLHSILRHIRFLADTQMTYPTYLIEGGYEDETHPDIIGALGSPLRVKATSLGSTATRNTILWTNFGRQWEIMDHYISMRTPPQDSGGHTKPRGGRSLFMEGITWHDCSSPDCDFSPQLGVSPSERRQSKIGNVHHWT
jgi:hypothetical protein